MKKIPDGRRGVFHSSPWPPLHVFGVASLLPSKNVNIHHEKSPKNFQYLGEFCRVKYDIFCCKVLSWVKVQWRGRGNRHFLIFFASINLLILGKRRQKPLLMTLREGCRAQQRHDQSRCLERSWPFHSCQGWQDFL